MTPESNPSEETKPTKTFKADDLTVQVYARPADLSADVARLTQQHLQQILASQGSAAVILATGNSQIQFLDALVKLGGVDWSKIILFHMDEYLGIAGDHKASFRHYMRERVESKLKPKQFHYLEGDALEPLKECARYTQLLQAQPIDLCCLGIGDNGHLAFNDPPVADFNDPHLVKLVKLDDTCKQQQVNQGHFPSLEGVPPYALTLTIPALCTARLMFCLAPGKHKATPVRDAIQGPVAPSCPASVLRQMPQATLFLDADSASLL